MKPTIIFRASYRGRGSENYGNTLYATPEPYYDFQGLYIIEPLKATLF